MIEGLSVWTGGQVANTTGLRVGANGILEITGPDLKLVYGGLTNEGRVNIAGEAALGLCAGVVENKGVFELENDQPIYQGGYCGPSLFVNTGWLRKSAVTEPTSSRACRWPIPENWKPARVGSATIAAASSEQARCSTAPAPTFWTVALSPLKAQFNPQTLNWPGPTSLEPT